MPDKPEHVDEELKSFSKTKLPHFFKYAKDKEEHQVATINDSTVNMLERIIPNKRIHFKKVAGDMDYTLFLYNKNTEIDKEVVKRYDEINRVKRLLMNDESNDDGFNIYLINELTSINEDVTIIVDSLVKTLFKRNSVNKDTLWNVFGEHLYNNLISKLGNTIQCETCTTRFKQNNDKHIYCEECTSNRIKETKLKSWNKNKDKYKK